MSENFFQGKPLLQAANHTWITLVPKKPTAFELVDFRLVSYVNLIYKILSEILANRMNEIANLLVFPNQTTFIRDRVITDNTLLAEEMLLGFGRVRTPKRWMLRKSFDTIRWDAIQETLNGIFTIFHLPHFQLYQVCIFFCVGGGYTYMYLQNPKSAKARWHHITYPLQSGYELP